MCMVVQVQQVTEILDLDKAHDITMKCFLSKTTVFLTPETYRYAEM